MTRVRSDGFPDFSPHCKGDGPLRDTLSPEKPSSLVPLRERRPIF